MTITRPSGPAFAPRWGRGVASRRRREDILRAAKSVFFREGYALATIDRIAEQAGTTKRTVYDHFGSKEALFRETIAFACAQFVNLLPAPKELPPEPRNGVRAYLERVRALVSSPEIVRFQRLVIAEAERQPDLGPTLHVTAIAPSEKRLADYLAAAVASGRAKPHDTAGTARTLLSFATAELRLRRLFGLDEKIEDAPWEVLLSEVLSPLLR